MGNPSNDLVQWLSTRGWGGGGHCLQGATVMQQLEAGELTARTLWDSLDSVGQPHSTNVAVQNRE